MRRIRGSYANVMATLAMFIALGGTSYAVITLPRNSVGSKQLRTNAVSSGKVRNGSIGQRDLAPSARGLRGPRGPAGPAGTAGSNGSAGAGNIIVRTRDASAARPDVAGGSTVKVATVSLPAGHWLVLATTEVTNITNPGVRDIFRCAIAVDGVVRGLGKVTDSGNAPGATSSSDVTLMEVVDKASAASVVLQCSHDTPLPAGTDFRFDRAKIVAVPVDGADVAEVAG